MTKIHFYRFWAYEDGKLANAELEEGGVPINIFVDNVEEYPDLPECDAEIEIFGASQELEVFETEEAYFAQGTNMAPQSLIPTGTFGMTGESKAYTPEPTILYSGIVRSVETREEAAENRPNYLLEVETYGMTFSLYARFDGEIRVGDIVSGSAWIYGDLNL